MSTLLILTIITVAIVLFFDYTNGFHDAANIVATIIASRAMTPVQAVIIVGTFEFLGPLLGGTAVANTIGKFVTLGDVQAVLSLAILISGWWVPSSGIWPPGISASRRRRRTRWSAG
jgi:PiT family inorganic phosphate transporter